MITTNLDTSLILNKHLSAKGLARGFSGSRVSLNSFQRPIYYDISITAAVDLQNNCQFWRKFKVVERKLGRVVAITCLAFTLYWGLFGKRCTFSDQNVFQGQI